MLCPVFRVLLHSASTDEAARGNKRGKLDCWSRPTFLRVISIRVGNQMVFVSASSTSFPSYLTRHPMQSASKINDSIVDPCLDLNAFNLLPILPTFVRDARYQGDAR